MELKSFKKEDINTVLTIEVKGALRIGKSTFMNWLSKNLPDKVYVVAIDHDKHTLKISMEGLTHI